MNQTTTPPRIFRRSWFRYSLRVILLIVAILCLALSWLAMRVQHVRGEREAIAAIGNCLVYYDYQRRGFDYSSDEGIETLNRWDSLVGYNFRANFVYDKRATPPGPAWLRKWFGDDILANVIYIHVEGTWPSADGKFPGLRFAKLAPLAQLAGLEDVTLERAVEPADLRYLLGLKNLRVIGLRHVSDAHLAELAPLVDLDRLTVVGDFTNEGLKHLGSLRGLKHLHLGSNEFDDDGMQFLRQLTSLETLCLPSITIGDEGIAACEEMTELKLLDLTRTAVDGRCFENLQRLTQLRFLNLGQTQIDNSAMPAIGHLSSLVELDLADTSISDAGLTCLRGLKCLRKLDLKADQISDEGLRSLCDQIELRDLNLGWTNVTDAGLAHLRNLSKLENVGLAGTKVTDTGLEYLRGFPNLRHLAVRGAAVTDAGVSAAKTAIPNLRVDGVATPESPVSPARPPLAPAMPTVDWTQPDDDEEE